MLVEELNGVGSKRAAVLNENGIFTIEDILNYFPKKYIDLSNAETFKMDGKNRLIKVTTIEDAKVVRLRGGLNYTSIKVIDEDNYKFTCVWFNQPYMKANLKVNTDYFFYGKNSPKKKNYFVVQMTIKNTNASMLSIYKTMEGIGQQTIKNLIDQSFKVSDFWSAFDKNLPLSLAYKHLHNPQNTIELIDAKARVNFEDAAYICAATKFNKNINKVQKTQNYTNLSEILCYFCNILPFSLSESQLKVIKELNNDFEKIYPINRIIDGDVGSGKTVIAFYAMLVASKNSYQSVMLAPTELLAKQHYLNAIKLFGKDNCMFLSSQTKSKELSRIQENSSLMIFGTQSVFSGKVKYKNLSMIIVDEQHRFGVGDRAKICDKGITPDVISMSATPIPRTLSLAFRGDLDVSELKSRPFAVNIQTNIVNSKREEDMYCFVAKKVNEGSKVFVVCSKIGDDEDEDELSYSATNVYQKLKSKFNFSIGLLTGKVKQQERDKVLSDFDAGNINLIVATTIVEVGIDIPDSDIMIIMTPENFGLATLHQLRGRVGRKGQQAYCFCLVHAASKQTLDRLDFFKSHNNGYELAEYDYNMRGAGETFGTKQHGKTSSDIITNIGLDTFKKAKIAVDTLCEKDYETYSKVASLAVKKFNNVFEKIILN